MKLPRTQRESSPPAMGLIGVLTALMVLCGEILLAQCPMCKTGLLASAEGQRMVSGFNTGILFLLAVPFLLVGMVSLKIYQAHRRGARAASTKG